jgi:hypothetical protein
VLPAAEDGDSEINPTIPISFHDFQLKIKFKSAMVRKYVRSGYMT